MTQRPVTLTEQQMRLLALATALEAARLRCRRVTLDYDAARAAEFRLRSERQEAETAVVAAREALIGCAENE